jgi:hypothetical protein
MKIAMNTKLNKAIFLTAVISIGPPYLVGRAYAEKKPRIDCDLRDTEMLQDGLPNGTSPKEDAGGINEAILCGGSALPIIPLTIASMDGTAVLNG